MINMFDFTSNKNNLHMYGLLAEDAFLLNTSGTRIFEGGRGGK